MSKETSDPSTFTPYIRYGFTEQFSGAAGSIEWTKWNEELKTAVFPDKNGDLTQYKKKDFKYDIKAGFLRF